VLSRAQRRRLIVALQGLPIWIGLGMFAVSLVEVPHRYAVLLVAALSVLVTVGLDFVFYGVLGGLDRARVGTNEQRRAVARRLGIGLDGIFTRSVNAMEAGELQLAEEILRRTPLADASHPFTLLASARLTILRGEAAARDDALDVLVAWEPPTVFASDEIERYHAYALARSLAQEAGSPRASRAATRLLAHEDAVVRAYGTWLTLRAAPGDEDDQEGPRVRVADPMEGAALARAAGEAELAEALEMQAARQAESGELPYRRPR
jgi:hypothetical protein